MTWNLFSGDQAFFLYSAMMESSQMLCNRRFSDLHCEDNISCSPHVSHTARQQQSPAWCGHQLLSVLIFISDLWFISSHTKSQGSFRQATLLFYIQQNKKGFHPNSPSFCPVFTEATRRMPTWHNSRYCQTKSTNNEQDLNCSIRA